MSDLSNIPPMQEEPLAGKATSSSWSMLFTMLLLIAGFLLASGMMLNQVFQAQTQRGKSGSELSAWFATAKSLLGRPESPAKPATEITGKQESTPLDSIKKIVGSQGSDHVKWPKLKLTGFGTSSDGTEGFAIINGDMVHQGQYIGKVKLEAVRAHDVVVEYQGERKTLTVNAQH